MKLRLKLLAIIFSYQQIIIKLRASEMCRERMNYIYIYCLKVEVALYLKNTGAFGSMCTLDNLNHLSSSC